MTPFLVTFPVGAVDSSTANVSVMVLNDDFVEGAETFIVSISNVTSDAIASAGNPDAATITITDNDSDWTN